MSPPNADRTYWTVGDGQYHYGAFGSARAAYTALKAAGFVSHKMVSENTIWFHTD